MPRKVIVILPTPATEVLEQLAKKQNITITEVIRHAISLEQQVVQELDEGAKILIQKKDGSYKELVADLTA